MNYNIRQAHKSELDDLNELNKEVQAIHHKIDREFFKTSRDSNIRAELEKMMEDEKCSVLVAVENKALLGFITFRECSLPESGLTNEIPMLFIHHMVVKSIFNKQGIGTAMMKTVFKEARHKDIKRVQLDVWTMNLDAKSFFQKRGFQTVNEIMVHKY